MQTWYKDKKIVLAVAALLLVLGGILFYKNSTSSEGRKNEKIVFDDQPRQGEIAVTGKLACTPLRSGATPTQENCVLGLQGDDGKFYAIDTTKIQGAEKGIEPDSSLKMIGTFAPANTTSSESQIFKYDGVLTLRLILNNK